MADALLAPQFEDRAQQHESAALGMWVFLTSEVMLFGGLFTAYTIYRTLYPHDFAAASPRLYESIGATNTAILIVSSLTMALAVRAAPTGARRATTLWLSLTVLLGLAFLGFKALEYGLDYTEHLVPAVNFIPPPGADPGPAELFMVFYFIMTGLHAVHVTCGIAMIAGLAAASARRRPIERLANTIEMTGLYWHLVDMIWIFLFPLLYLVK
ncbi:MAG: cytochrome c oxidase subunit 3 [Phycisphaerales bacterium]|nr:cytochrome c oxidase subunit 3 [Phycisphaerales bacterium]